MTKPTDAQMFVLRWLSQADISALGECKGAALDALIEAGLAEIINPDAGDWAGVRLTEAGWGVHADDSVEHRHG